MRASRLSAQTTTRILLGTVLALAAMVPLSLVTAQEAERQETISQDEPRPDFRRDKVRRPSSGRPTTPALPSGLRLKAPTTQDPSRQSSSSRSSGGQKGTIEVRDKPRTGGDVASRDRRGEEDNGAGSPAPMATYNFDDVARQAGRWAARKLTQEKGFSGYLSVGVYEGMQRAVNSSSSLGSWDYRDGVHRGQSDPEAIRLGETSGAQTAEEWARQAADDQVEQQFRDLGREPVHDPILDQPHFSPSTGLAPEPQLDAVFEALPISSYSMWHSDLRETFRATGKSPWQLFSAGSHDAVYDKRWSSPRNAFSFWKKDSSRSSAYRKLSDKNDKKRFESIFEYELQRQLATYQNDLQRAYEQGYAAGWDYGAAVSYEWQYRRGYTEGFNQVLGDTAQRSFGSVYPSAYHRAYSEAFQRWSQNAAPDLLELNLRDGNDDGIFEPGEELLADYTLANYGGAVGEVTLSLSGPDLLQPGTQTVTIRARSQLRSRQPVLATIDPQARIRSLSLIDLLAGEARRSADMLVSYPLEFAMDPTLTTLDTVNGRASFSLQVTNRSRKPYPAVVELVAVDGYDLSDRRRLGSLAAGASSEVDFSLEQLRPVDLLPGGLGVHFAVGTGSKVHDEMVFAFPDAVRDLSKRDLVVYLLQVASRPTVDPGEVAALHDMVAQRLQVDWQVVMEAKGNRYKQDNKKNTRQTALGDLVQSYLEQRDYLQSPEVIQALRPRLRALTEQFPGVHPLLKKHFRRLVDRLQ